MDGADRKRSLEQTATKRNRIHLLLHCVDGCVPYLNPNLMEKHFPPSETDLWLGLAARDSCVVPIFTSSSISDVTQLDKGKGKTKKKQSRGTKNKIRGYTFAATSPDPWLLPYQRLTVPSFDIRDLGLRDKTATTTSNGISNGNTSKNTNNAIHVWTPHGRQKLTADLYATASLEGLKSQHTLSLFDDIDEGNFSTRRKQKAETRNRQWFQHLSSRHSSLSAKVSSSNGSDNDTETRESGDSNLFLWKPILLPHGIEKDSEQSKENAIAPVPTQRETVTDGNSTHHVPSGIAFVGHWRAGFQLDEMIDKDIMSNNGLDPIRWKAILSTYSLSEILDIASTGIVNVIGTNLPQRWAKEKLALGLDLSFDHASGNAGNDQETKRQKVHHGETAASSERNVTIADKAFLNADGCMDLSDKVYARDPRPLVVGCDSFVCRETRFSRAYIHHLVVAKEMLAEILIFGHNLHCLLKLLRLFNSEEKNRKTLEEFIRGQLRS